PLSGNTYLFLSKLLVEELRPVTLQDHINSLFVLSRLALRGGEQIVRVPFPDGGSSHSSVTLGEVFNRWADLLLHHFAGRPSLRMLWAVPSGLKLERNISFRLAPDPVPDDE